MLGSYKYKLKIMSASPPRFQKPKHFSVLVRALCVQIFLGDMYICKEFFYVESISALSHKKEFTVMKEEKIMT